MKPTNHGSEPGNGPWPADDGTCRRCGFAWDSPFCPQCGQKRARRLTVSGPLKDLSRHLVSFDSAFAKTLLDLTTRPGEALRRYVAGDRTSYLNPAKYAFLSATLYALLVNLLGVDLRPEQWRLDDGKGYAAMKLVVSMVGYLVFIYMLPAAALMRRIYRTSGFNFAECYAVLLFFAGHYILLLSLLLPFGIYGQVWGFIVIRLIGLVLLLHFIREVFDTSMLRKIFGSIAVFALIFVGSVAAGMVTVGIGYWWQNSWT